MKALLFMLACAIALAACDDNGNPDPNGVKQRAIDAEKAWNGPCADVSTLLATTAGSPSEQTCPNKHHHMHVQVASKPSNEEFGALVFCECERPGEAAADAGTK